MLNEVQLKGVRMSGIPDSNGLQHIEAVTDGSSVWSVAQVINLLQSGQIFFVLDRLGNRANVEAVYPGAGLLNMLHSAYIKTRSDGLISDNLLALPGGPLYQRGIIANALRGY